MDSDDVTPAAQAAYPSAPPVRESEAGPVLSPPMPVTLSFWGWLFSAALWVVGGILFFSAKPALVNALRQSNTNLRTGQLTDAQIQQTANAAVIGALVVAIVIAALYTLFAFKLRAGRNWARIVLTIIAVLALVVLITQAHAGSVLSLVGAGVAVVAAVLSYLPSANAYIAASKHARLR